MARRPRATHLSASRTVDPAQRGQGGSLSPGQQPPVITPEQHAERRAFVESLLLAGMTNSRVVAICAQPLQRNAQGHITSGLGLGPSAVIPICIEIRRQWADDYKAREATRRTDQLARLQNDTSRMRTQANVPWSTVQQTEKLIAEIEGNLAPRRLEVGVHAVPDALAASLAGMTEADVEAIIAEERENAKKLAAIPTTAEASPVP